MRNFLILVIFLIFIFSKGSVVIGASYALNLWSKSVFPILFPTFILSDLVLSSNIINLVTKKIGKLFGKFFKTSQYALYIFLISLLSGTPTNAKNLKVLYDEGVISLNSITKILSFTYFFNPFFILSFTSYKILLIFWGSNLITGFLLRNYYQDEQITRDTNLNIKFNFSKSIATNMNIIINILGTITIFMVISYAVPFINEYVNVIFTSFLELSSGLYKIKMYFDLDYMYLIALSFGGISILMQIKSILKDTFVDYKFIIFSRILTCLLSLVICYLA